MTSAEPVITNQHCQTLSACLTPHIQEATVVSEGSNPVKRTKVKLPVEPVAMALGPFHMAAAMNNSVWYYTVDEAGR
jgi:outer membrane protein assembly factor BamE (lipoprotein component of BamABCDE complex)